MNRKRKLAVFMLVSLSIISASACRSKAPTRNRLDENHFPHVVLWAWERPEDLRSFDPSRFAVAFLAQPLDVAPQARLMAVTRIESEKLTGERAALSNAQRKKAVDLIMRTTQLRNVAAIQIDFDATTSERAFYRALLQDLRAQLPGNVPLSMTALASFCIGDRWLSELPVDEAVPMIFRMGADDKAIKSLLSGGEDFREPLCQRSYGVASDEPLDMQFKSGRRVYVFNQRSWKPSDAATINERLSQ
jgi:hypothetical protein